MNVYNVLVCHGMVVQTPRMSEISLPLEKLTDVMGKWNFPEMNYNFTGQSKKVSSQIVCLLT